MNLSVGVNQSELLTAGSTEGSAPAMGVLKRTRNLVFSGIIGLGVLIGTNGTSSVPPQVPLHVTSLATSGVDTSGSSIAQVAIKGALARGYSAIQLSALLGVSRRTIYDWASGKTIAKKRQPEVIRILTALDSSIFVLPRSAGDRSWPLVRARLDSVSRTRSIVADRRVRSPASLEARRLPAKRAYVDESPAGDSNSEQPSASRRILLTAVKIADGRNV